MFSTSINKLRAFSRRFVFRAAARVALLLLVLSVLPALMLYANVDRGVISMTLFAEVWLAAVAAVVLLMPGEGRLEDSEKRTPPQNKGDDSDDGEAIGDTHYAQTALRPVRDQLRDAANAFDNPLAARRFGD